MHRIDTPTAEKDKFGPGKNGFRAGNPQTGALPTSLNNVYWDSVQEEICGVIEGAGIELDKSKRDQLLAALNKRYLKAESAFSELVDLGLVPEALSNLGLSELALVGAATGVLGGEISAGYFKIPGIVGGQRRELIIQWYTAVAPSVGTFYFNFPIPFPNSFFADACMPGGSSGSVVNGGNVTKTARQLYFNFPMSAAIIAIGW